MPISDLSDSTQNYLKMIWGIKEHSSGPVTASALVALPGLRKSSVSDVLKRLAAAGLVEHQPYGAIELTELGRGYALEVIRRHRLIETFLVETLGYRWDQVHDEAEVLEHAVSDFLVERLDAFLAYPRRDPHGDPIPSAQGEIEELLPLTLADLPADQGKLELLVERISDADPDLLRRLAALGVGPGSRLRLSGQHEGQVLLSLLPSQGREPDQGREEAFSLSLHEARALTVSYLP